MLCLPHSLICSTIGCRAELKTTVSGFHFTSSTGACTQLCFLPGLEANNVLFNSANLIGKKKHLLPRGKGAIPRHLYWLSSVLTGLQTSVCFVQSQRREGSMGAQAEGRPCLSHLSPQDHSSAASLLQLYPTSFMFYFGDP